MSARPSAAALGSLVAVLAAVYVGAAATMPPGHDALAAFELSVGLAQLAWGALVWRLRARPAVVWAGLAGQLLLIGLWVLSRTIGLGGQGTLPVGELDVMCLCDELLAAWLALGLLRPRGGSSLAVVQLAVALAAATAYAWGGGHTHAAGASAAAAFHTGGAHLYCRLL